MDTHVLIPKEIDEDEPCIRCVPSSKMHRGKFKDDAMLPREGRNDVSVLREKYTTIDFCVEHGKSIDKKTHKLGALVRFSQKLVDEVNEWAQTKESEVVDANTKKTSVCGMKGHLEYSPMDGEDYVDKEKDYYIDSPISLPMHADLIFEEPLERGLVRIKMRKYGNELIKRSQKAYMSDDDDLGDWTLEIRLPV